MILALNRLQQSNGSNKLWHGYCKMKKKFTMKNWIVLAFLFCALGVFAQPRHVPTEVINGKKYYVHFVQAGNTLWGIHKLYNVPVEDIVKLNPGSEKGLSEGQRLIIPVVTQTILHEVAKRETLFGISKKYGVSIETILIANPEAESGIKVGQKLKIPGVETVVLETSEEAPVIIQKEPVKETKDTTKLKSPPVKISFTDTVILHTVLDHETLYSISKRFMVSVEELQRVNCMKNTRIRPGDVLKIPVRQEKIESVKIRQIEKVEKPRKVDSTLLFPKKKRYKIAILLPFYLDKGEGSSDHVSNLAAEFYMGAKLAIDSLERLGLKADFYVYDSRNDTNTVKNILAKPEFQEMDVVFGPLFPDNLDVVASWCKENKVRLVCPAVANSNLLKDNPFVYNAIPSDMTLMKGLAEFTLQNNRGDQIIMIKPTKEKDSAMYDSFRSTFLTSPVIGIRPKLVEATLDNYTSFIKKGVKVILVFPTNEKTLAMKFMNNLNNVAQKLNSDMIYVYGTKDWVNFDDIKPHYKNKYNFHFASSNDLNYRYPQTEKLHYKYRSEYNADMTKMAVQGFDVLYYFCSDLLMSRKTNGLIMNNFNLKQIGPENGYENSNYYILEQEDFELINVLRVNE